MDSSLRQHSPTSSKILAFGLIQSIIWIIDKKYPNRQGEKQEMKQYIIALDQGTTSSRAIAFDRAGRIVAMAQKELTQIYPQPGYVEQDPLEIYATQSGVLAEE